MDIPDALEPRFARTGTESEVLLFSGPLVIMSNTGRKATGQGTISFRVRPSPQLSLHASVTTAVLGSGPLKVSWATGSGDLVGFHTTPLSSGMELRGRLSSPRLHPLQAEDRAVEVRAELINFPPAVIGSAAGRSVWTAAGLEFTLDRMPGAREAERLLKDGAGYALTHVIAIRREDANPIGVADFEAIADTLYDALSFCACSYVGIARAAGLDGSGARVWEIWDVSRTQFWSNRLSWLPPAKASSNPELPRPQRPLEVVMPQVMALSRREPWSRNGIFRNLVASLCEGMRGSSVEIRLATVLTGLELLAWCQLVLVSRIRTDDDFRGDFGPQLELLLTRCGICLDVPKALPDLAHYAKTLKKGGVTGNGPRAIVEARNRVVHPPTHDRYVPEHSVREQAWLLALRYLELGILEGCGYDGDPLPPWALSPPPPRILVEDEATKEKLASKMGEGWWSEGA